MNLREIREGQLFKLKNNKIVRTLCYPFIYYKRKIGLKKYAKSVDAKYIKTLKNTKIGKRCFIIGNGPSLTTKDLEKIAESDSFAFNRIYYLFDKTSWRPTYYMCVDPGVLGLNMPEIRKLKLPNIILSSIAKKNVGEKADNVHYIYDYSKFKINRWDFDPPYISEDVSNHFCFCYTVTFDALQLAFYMGYSEIVLLGVDHNYSVKVDTKGHVIRDDSVKDYFDGLEKTAITAMNFEATTAAFNVARKYADMHKIKIYNATRGGKLEVFERVDLDSIL